MLIYNIHGFLIKHLVRFDKPIYMLGRLNFFNVKIRM